MSYLANVNDVQKAIGLTKWGIAGKALAWLLYQWAELPEINRIYTKVEHLEGSEFFGTLLQTLGLSYELHEEDLKRIPEKGAFIIVANHPLGTLDGILLMKIISQVRPDFKIMGNFLLQKIKPLEEMVISVNPFETRKNAYSSMSGMKEALLHLKDGKPLGIFPAGEVSRKNFKTGEIRDRKWQTPVLKLIKKAEVPVIPVYFHAKNGRVFYRWGRIHPDIQTVLLPVEMIRKRIKPIKLRIGKAIIPKHISDFTDIEELGNFLQKKVYMLKSFYDERKKLLSNLPIPTLKKKERIEPIAEETAKILIIKEIEKLKKNTEKLFFNSNNYSLFFTTAEAIPNILREIGRLREVTFREIGEGTNKSLDLDEYDKHYHHLFLWDNEAEKIAGAYRMVLGEKAYKKFGINGFYASTLFNFEPEIHPFFKKTIEMGRAFVVPDYQQRPLPLFLLWKGIVHVCLRFPEHKFLMGGVSISNKFSDFSKSLIVDFMRSHYYDPVVARYVFPKKEYKVKLSEEEREIFFGEAENDLNKFDKIIDELEPSNLRLPVLIKKYFKQNAKVIAFNVDPNFNDSVDGLMYIRISDLPESTVKPVMEEMQADLEKIAKELNAKRKQQDDNL